MGGVFLYSETCPRCLPTLLSIAALFDEYGESLLARKPTLDEISMPGFAFPALWLPKQPVPGSRDVILIGDNMVEAARSVLDSRRESVEKR
jgi:hypothetical protein